VKSVVPEGAAGDGPPLGSHRDGKKRSLDKGNQGLLVCASARDKGKGSSKRLSHRWENVNYHPGIISSTPHFADQSPAESVRGGGDAGLDRKKDLSPGNPRLEIEKPRLSSTEVYSERGGSAKATNVPR